MDMEECYNCDKEMDKPYWENILKAFCSLECTNQYLDSEGFEPICGPGESSHIKGDN